MALKTGALRLLVDKVTALRSAGLLVSLVTQAQHAREGRAAAAAAWLQGLAAQSEELAALVGGAMCRPAAPTRRPHAPAWSPSAEGTTPAASLTSTASATATASASSPAASDGAGGNGRVSGGGTQTESPMESLPEMGDPPRGKDKRFWAALTAREQAAAASLGFSAFGWDEGMSPERCAKPWANLSPEARRAATVLGYTSAEWDDELVEVEERNAVTPEVEEEEDQMEEAMSLGYEPAHEHHMVGISTAQRRAATLVRRLAVSERLRNDISAGGRGGGGGRGVGGGGGGFDGRGGLALAGQVPELRREATDRKSVV